jgi:hypothetical protein
MQARIATRTFDELQATGLLWLINRTVFHPRGFALGLVYSDGEVAGWALQGDGRDPYRYGDDIDEPDLLAAVEHEFAARRSS